MGFGEALGEASSVGLVEAGGEALGVAGHVEGGGFESSANAKVLKALLGLFPLHYTLPTAYYRLFLIETSKPIPQTYGLTSPQGKPTEQSLSHLIVVQILPFVLPLFRVCAGAFAQLPASGLLTAHLT